MAQFTGFGSGLLDASKANAEIQSREADTEGRRSQTRLNEMAGQRVENEYQDEQRSKLLLRNAFAAKIPDEIAKDEVQANNFVANQNIEAGKQIMGLNPKYGIQLIQEGSRLKQEASMVQLRNAQIKSAQLEAAGGVAAGVADQDSLDAAIPELSKYGVIVPEKYKVWSPETKLWFDKRAIANKAYQQSILLGQKQAALDYHVAESENKNNTRNARTKIAEEKEARLRSGLGAVSSTKGYTPLNGKSLEVTVAELSGEPEFKSIKDGNHKIAAAQDYADLIVSHMQDGSAKGDRMKARELAKQDIKSFIDEDGAYKPISRNKLPAAGDIIDGWKFTGGDAGNKANWVKE